MTETDNQLWDSRSGWAEMLQDESPLAAFHSGTWHLLPSMTQDGTHEERHDLALGDSSLTTGQVALLIAGGCAGINGGFCACGNAEPRCKFSN